MVFAHARSVREERSKQRFALQDFSRIRVSLVKGKAGWRIGSVESLGNSFLEAKTREERGYVSFLITQLRKYVHGEIAMFKVYDDIVDILEALSSYGSSWEKVRRIFMLRLLSELGYIAPLREWKALIEAPEFRAALAEYEDPMETSIEKTLASAAQASHL